MNLELLHWRRGKKNYCHCFRKRNKTYIYAAVIFMKIFCVDELADRNKVATFVKTAKHKLAVDSQEEDINK